MSLTNQLILPGGASSQRFSAVVKKPAAVLMAEGETPPPMSADPLLEVESVRPLDLVEAQALIEAEDQRKRLPSVPIDASGIMRTRHHAIARLMATGAKYSEVCRAVGCSAQTLKLLERSPAFQALLLEYMNMMDKTGIEAVTKMKVLGSLGVDALISRLADPASEKNLKPGELLEIVKVASDRTGLGPTSKSVTLNGRITPADIRALKDAQTVFEAGPADWTEVGEDGGEVSVSGDFQGEPTAEAGPGFREGRGERPETADDLSDLLPSLDTLFRREG